MTAFEFGLYLNRISMKCDDETYKKIKPDLDRLEVGIVELFEELNNKEKNK